MDPVSAKFLQLMFLELIGAAVLIGGLINSFLNLSGKTHLLLKGGGLTIRLKNATPGAIIALIGLGAIWLSLDSKIVREETTITEPETVQPSSPGSGPTEENPSAPTQQPDALPKQERKTTRTEVFMEQKRSVLESFKNIWGKDDQQAPPLERVQ